MISSSGARNKLVNACGPGALLSLLATHLLPPPVPDLYSGGWPPALQIKTWPKLAAALPAAGPAAVRPKGPAPKDWGGLGENVRGLSCTSIPLSFSGSEAK